MNNDTLDLIIAAAVLVAALAVAAVCGIGLVVWLAGGRPDQGRNRKAV